MWQSCSPANTGATSMFWEAGDHQHRCGIAVRGQEFSREGAVASIYWPTGSKGLVRLGQIAEGLLRRQGGCTGCALQGTCGTFMPLVQLYRKASASLALYCQHKEPTGGCPMNDTDEIEIIENVDDYADVAIDLGSRAIGGLRKGILRSC